jgi:hypothetical protein
MPNEYYDKYVTVDKKDEEKAIQGLTQINHDVADIVEHEQICSQKSQPVI